MDLFNDNEQKIARHLIVKVEAPITSPLVHTLLVNQCIL